MTRVFWREADPWVLLRTTGGLLLAVPWSATDLPVPVAGDDGAVDEADAVLLTPAVLRALARFLHSRSAGARERGASTEGGNDD